MTLELDTRQRAMLQEMGVRVWLPGTALAPIAPLVTLVPLQIQASAPAVFSAPPPSPPSPRPSAAVPTRTVDASALDWSALVQAASSCQACGLCAGRKNTTLQAQSLQNDWMVVGDPPDDDEDRTGQPFAGAPGLLLDNMLKAVGASRNSVKNGVDNGAAQGVYATNIVKCRPPQGRIPRSEELAQCTAYLQREIALVQPKVILAMGRFAMQVLLSEHGDAAMQPLGKLRGTVYRYQGVPVVVTYAPKVLLRASADKGKAWADLCLAMDVLVAA